MSEINRIKQLIENDLVVDAVELPSNHRRKSELINELEDTLSHYDDDMNYAHFVVRVKRTSKPLHVSNQDTVVPEPTLQNLNTDNFSIDQLVNETLESSSEISKKRTEMESISDEYDSSFLLENAKVLSENNETALARNIYKTLIRKGQHVAEALCGIAYSYENEGAFTEAAKYYEEAIAYNPDVNYYERLSNLLIRISKDEEAIEVLERALGIPGISDTQKFEFYKSLGNCYSRLDKHEKAEQHYMSAFELNEDSDALQVNVGSLALQKGDHATAKRHFQRALELNSKNDKALCGLGMIDMLNNQLEQAQTLFVNSLKQNPDNLTAIFNLVKCAYQTKKFRDSAYFLQNYISNNIVNVNILYTFAGVLYHQEEYEKALVEINKVLEINPNHTGAIELSELIKKKLSN